MPSTIPAGTRVPDTRFRTRADDAWKDVTTAELFAGKTVIVFGLPGAFTPTCSTSHVPRYNELQPRFAALGVDAILCVSVNDAFVMNAWQADQDADRLTFVPDGNGTFSEAMGMLVDKANLGFGKRSWRYSMLVRDGAVVASFVEPDVPGDPFQVSDADTMLRYLDPDAAAEPDVFMLVKKGCSHCARAEALLQAAGVTYDAVEASPRMLRAVSSTATTPRVFVDGELLGGAEELASWLDRR